MCIEQQQHSPREQQKDTRTRIKPDSMRHRSRWRERKTCKCDKVEDKAKTQRQDRREGTTREIAYVYIRQTKRRRERERMRSKKATCGRDKSNGVDKKHPQTQYQSKPPKMKTPLTQATKPKRDPVVLITYKEEEGRNTRREKRERERRMRDKNIVSTKITIHSTKQQKKNKHSTNTHTHRVSLTQSLT